MPSNGPTRARPTPWIAVGWIVCALLFIVVVVTLPAGPIYRSEGGWQFWIGYGGIGTGWEKSSPFPPGWSTRDNMHGTVAWIPGWYSGKSGWGVHLPLAVPIFIIGVANLVASSLRQRARQRCCPCGYDLTGNTTGVCPECGHAIG